MRVTKSKKSETYRQANRFDSMPVALTPFDEKEFPKIRGTEKFIKYRLYTRPRFIVYEVCYLSTKEVYGFQIIYFDMVEGELESIAINSAPYKTLWELMEVWCDKNENNPKFKVLAS